MTEEDRLCSELERLTSTWTVSGSVPVSEQMECRVIGEQLNRLGGIELMREAYYRAKAGNRAITVVQAYWDGIGEWRW